jgi:hypothetical protein
MLYWKNQPLDELPRGELIKCIEYLWVRLAEYQTPEAIRERAIGRVQVMKTR